MDHDRLFKQLLQTFFKEFLSLFLPDVLEYIEPGSIEFLDKEIFTDIAGGDRHEVDLLVKCRFRGQDTYLLILAEAQSYAQPDFAARVFFYVARLMERHRLPVYPIALLTYDSPERPEPDEYVVAFPDMEMLRFRFRAIQLNRLNWRDFVPNVNPVAVALMTRMKIADDERPRVKFECLQIIARLKLDKARQALIGNFMDAYLQLNREEFKVYYGMIQAIQPPEREVVMQIVNEFQALGEEIGEARGERRSLEGVVFNQIVHHLGQPPADLADRIRQLPSEKLRDLSLSLFDFQSLADVESWIAAHG